MDHNRLTAAYVKIRDARAEAKREFEARDKEFKAKLERIEAEMLRSLNDSGATSMKTENGTFFKVETITPSCKDWDAFYVWIAEHNAFEALERRVKQSFVKDYMEAHEGGLPPGVEIYREFNVNVRRSSDKPSTARTPS